MHPVKIHADILPAGGDQYLSLQINDTDADVGQCEKRVHGRLHRLNVNQVSQRCVCGILRLTGLMIHATSPVLPVSQLPRQ